MGTIRPNRAKQKLASGETVLTLNGVDDPGLIDKLGPLGIDVIWLEAEHGPVDFADIGNLTRACDLWGMTSVVRVNKLDYGLIYRTLDVGAQAICVPHIDTADDARAFVEAAKFAPIGKRGLFTSRQGYGVDNFTAVANDQSMLVALIEDIKAIENLDAILEVDHIDVFYVAPSDLASSMGLIGQPEHPEVDKVREQALRKIVARGRHAGTMLTGNQNGARFKAMGVQMFGITLDSWIAAGLARLKEELGER
jgi:4-hydroxy-2-oxoheptanedioate aldolase